MEKKGSDIKLEMLRGIGVCKICVFLLLFSTEMSLRRSLHCKCQHMALSLLSEKTLFIFYLIAEPQLETLSCYIHQYCLNCDPCVCVCKKARVPCGSCSHARAQLTAASLRSAIQYGGAALIMIPNLQSAQSTHSI